MNVKRAIMPNDSAIVDPNTGRLNQAWVHYLGQLDKLSAALEKIGTIQGLDDDATLGQVRTKVNEIILALNGEQ